MQSKCREQQMIDAVKAQYAFFYWILYIGLKAFIVWYCVSWLFIQNHSVSKSSTWIWRQIFFLKEDPWRCSAMSQMNVWETSSSIS